MALVVQVSHKLDAGDFTHWFIPREALYNTQPGGTRTCYGFKYKVLTVTMWRATCFFRPRPQEEDPHFLASAAWRSLLHGPRMINVPCNIYIGRLPSSLIFPTGYVKYPGSLEHGQPSTEGVSSFTCMIKV